MLFAGDSASVAYSATAMQVLMDKFAKAAAQFSLKSKLRRQNTCNSQSN